MRVDFCKGLLKGEQGTQYAASWAKTPFGIMMMEHGEEGVLEILDGGRIFSEELIAEVDLPGLDRKHLEEMVRSVLAGGYLDKPGVAGKSDAVIFALVNEALHRLARIAEDEEL